MRIHEAVECMSKIYLHRVLDSYIKDTIKPDEGTSRKRISADSEILAKTENIAKRLNFSGLSFDSKMLSIFLLEALMDAQGYTLDERAIVDLVINYEERVVADAAIPDTFKFKNSEAINTYKTVLEVALEDNGISEDERNLLIRLRTHLSLSLRDHFLIQATLGKFPKVSNELHTEKEIKNALVELQRRGVVFYCNQCNEGAAYVIPEEMVPGLKHSLGIELSENAFLLLLANLTGDALWQILDAHKLPVSGKKDERIQRIIRAEIKPSEALTSLSNEELYGLCKGLPGVNVSGSKATRIQNIINHFDKLRIVATQDVTDPRERLYEYYVELATRDRENLLSNKVISKDKDMDSAFEEATRYLFEKKLGLALEPTPGTEHADGVLKFRKSKELFMWDTKSKETIYEFPNDHFNQFKRYIHNSTERVNCFMVIAPKISEKAEENAYKLKIQSGADTDISLIAAEDLKWVAENWAAISSYEIFDLDVFNYTGILDRNSLRKRMNIFLK